MPSLDVSTVVPRRRRLVVGVSVILALIATACRTEVAFSEPVDPPPTSEAVGDESTVETPVATPAPAPSPVVPTPSPSPTAPPAPPSFVGQRPADPVLPSDWADPIALDDRVVEGRLANGMRYLVRNNNRPGSQAQLRLVVHAGSINEPDGSEGVAHFLEHMMFNGTERFPGNDIVRVLEGFGSAFGPDVNAYTSFEETVYELQVPARSTDTVQLGLDVLAQWATAATLETAAVVAERGVVREEHRRSVETVSGRIGQQVREVLFEGTPYLGREPIGLAGVIEATTADQLREFYDAWYRPELMTVVVVGDIDVADVERRLAATFTQPGSETPTEPLPVVIEPASLPEPVFDVITDREIQRAEIEILWRLEGDTLTTRAGVRRDLVSAVAMTMVNDRLFERVQGGSSVFLTAGAASSDFTTRTELASLSATASAPDLASALTELLTEVERARQFGFTQPELDRTIEELRVGFAQQYAERDTRQDDALAQDLVSYALGRDVLPDADTQFQVLTEVLDSLTLDDMERHLYDLLASEPYVLLTAPEAVSEQLPEPEDLADIYFGIVGTEVEPEERSANTVTALMARPEPAEIVDRRSIDSLQAEIVTYANGARLVYRQTEITENIVLLRAKSPGGFFAVDGPEVPLLDRSAALVAGSGFESIDIVTLERLLSGSLASLSTSIGRSDESISGESSTDDLEDLFQLLHLQMTEATISDLRVRQFLDRWTPLAENPASNPAIAADLELWRLRYGTSPWFRLIPTTADLETLDADLLLEGYRDRFADAGDFVFAVVGDFDPSTLVDLGARYVGTLPDSGRRETPIDRDPGVPEENLIATVEAGIGDQGRVRINWESPYPFTLEDEVAARALEIVVDARLRDLIREQLSASYAPSADVVVLDEPKAWVDTIIEVESDPERVEEVSLAVRAELDRIRSGELDPLYLELAVDQLTEGYRFFTNNNWLDLLIFHSTYPQRPAGEFRDRTAIAQSLTIADLAATAEVVFPAGRSVEVRLVPES